MADAVVNLFESIKITEKQTKRFCPTIGQHRLSDQVVLEQHPVGQMRQWIVKRQMLQFYFELTSLGDVVDNGDKMGLAGDVGRR